MFALIPEVFSHGQRSQSHSQADAGRFIHLPVDQNRVFENTGLNHLAVHLSPFTGTLTNACKDRIPLVHMGNRADQLLDNNRLANAGTTKYSRLATPCERRKKIDYF